jgi:VWFA-related protein
MRFRTRILLAILAVPGAITLGPAASAQGRQSAPQVPVFRSAVTVVPIDVRVTDKDGKPVTDLRPEEFTIVEDGVTQDLRHFSMRTYATEPAKADADLALREAAFSIEPQTNRIFLIVLGRGKLQEPSRAIDALTRFVREQLLPQDQVAVFAYNRATTFTRNHASIVTLLGRFKLMHEQVDYEIGLQMSGLAAVYGSKAIPRSLQGKIDMLFTGSGMLGSQRLDQMDATASRVQRDADRQTDAQIQKEIEVAKAEMAAAANLTNYTTWSDLDEIQTGMFADLSLEAFISSTAQTLQDLGNIYAGIEYLRHFEGEKHIVFFTERGLTLPRLEEDEILAAAANDARVAIDTVETGGLYSSQAGGLPEEGRWNQTFAFKTLRTIAELTGGVSSIAEPGTKAMERINDVTRSGYLLGYYPTNGNWNGNYRKVTVKVSRRGVNVFYRHGYYSRKELTAFNRREFVASDRVRAAASFRREIKDIRLKVDASMGKAENGSGYEIKVDVNIDPSKLAFTFVEDVHSGKLSIGVFCWDEKGNAVGNSLQTADVKLKDDDFKRVLASGIPYRVRFPVNPAVRSVRVVVYDSRADLIGSADKKLR